MLVLSDSKLGGYYYGCVDNFGGFTIEEYIYKWIDKMQRRVATLLRRNGDPNRW
jgi:hypothetical protein